jgi:hypothetical protein
MAHRERGSLEQPRQFALDDLGGTKCGAVVDHEDLFMAGRRHRFSPLEAAGRPLVPDAEQAVAWRRNHGTRTGRCGAHDVILRHLGYILRCGGFSGISCGIAFDVKESSNPKS